jgi:lipopolysaccharide export system protein LptA
VRRALLVALLGWAGPALAQQPPAPAPAPPTAVAPESAAVPESAAAPAREPSTCYVQIDTSRRSNFRLERGFYNTYAGGGVWAHCRAQPTTMYADSVEWRPGLDLLYLIGRVHFRDSVSVLDADRVTYYLNQERLYAEGHVHTRNVHSGSSLTGSNLDYYRASPPLRDTLELYANQRPTIRFYPSNRASPADTEPFVVVADRTHMRGSDQMWAGGSVTIDRSDLAARGDSAQLDLGRRVASLLGSPEVNGTGNDAYHLRGDRINFLLTPRHEIKQVVSEGDATARGSDWRLDADTLDLALDSGKVQRARAWGTGHRPDAISGVHTIVADSLDIHMPDQLVRLVWAFHDARMTTRDTVAKDEDWLAGDSLRADFGVRRDSASARPKSELEHLFSYGSARALYHVESADSAQVGGRKGVNYSRGDRIAIAMAHSRVETVDVVGKVDGMYLEPIPPGADTAHAADSTRRADSTRAVADSTAAPDSARAARTAAPDAVASDSARSSPAPAAADSTRPPPPRRPGPR